MDQATRYIPVKAFHPFMESNAVHESMQDFQFLEDIPKPSILLEIGNMLFGAKN
jgi:hypothetical protein